MEGRYNAIRCGFVRAAEFKAESANRLTVYRNISLSPWWKLYTSAYQVIIIDQRQKVHDSRTQQFVIRLRRFRKRVADRSEDCGSNSWVLITNTSLYDSR